MHLERLQSWAVAYMFMSYISLLLSFIACTLVQLPISRARKSQLSQDGMKLTSTYLKADNLHFKFKGGMKNMVCSQCPSACHHFSNMLYSKGQLFVSTQQSFTSLIQTSTILHTLQVFRSTSLKLSRTALAFRLHLNQLLTIPLTTAAAWL